METPAPPLSEDPLGMSGISLSVFSFLPDSEKKHQMADDVGFLASFISICVFMSRYNYIVGGICKLAQYGEGHHFYKITNHILRISTLQYFPLFDCVDW